jgi:hypothetical protein
MDVGASRTDGISIANLGGEGEMDFFLGAQWVHRAAGEAVTINACFPAR